MNRTFYRELDKIKKQILSLGTLVEESVRKAAKAIAEMDVDLARDIIRNDHLIDDMDVEIEEECLKVLALHQPVAMDLRFVVVVIKINKDLERIGDQAVNIAQRVQYLSTRKSVRVPFDYATMAQKVQTMLKMSLDALVNLDSDQAFKVVLLDDEVDKIKNDAYDQIKKAIQETPDRVGAFVNLLLISRHLERLADHTTNIAEEVIYLIEGEIVRHSKI